MGSFFSQSDLNANESALLARAEDCMTCCAKPQVTLNPTRRHEGMKRETIAELATADHRNRIMRGFITELVKNGECFCADYVAANGPCDWCKAKHILELLPPQQGQAE